MRGLLPEARHVRQAVRNQSRWTHPPYPQGRETESVRQQVAIGSTWCQEHNCPFLLITDAELRAGSHLTNAKLLYRYSRLQLPEPLLRYVRSTLPPYPTSMSFGTLMRCLADGEQMHLRGQPCWYTAYRSGPYVPPMPVSEMPEMMRRWKMAYIIRTGAEATAAAAIVSPWRT